MDKVTKRHIIKVPINISIYYCTQKNIILISNSFTQKLLKLKTKLIIQHSKKLIKITREPVVNFSNHEKKKLKSIQSTYAALLKQVFLEMSLFFCKKLNLIGVGYRVFLLNIGKIDILHFKLGHSHSIYFKVPQNLKFFCLKSNKLFIVGNSYSFVTQIAALIKSYKMPEPYKGKGILYATEKIVLKEGKKI